MTTCLSNNQNVSLRNDDGPSYGNMLQSDSSSWQEVAERNDSMEPGECINKPDCSESHPNILNLEHIEGQVLLGVGMPEWGEVLQKDDEGRLLDMSFMSCDAEKRMLRATIIERSKEINRLQKELSTVFQIIHQLKQENEYLTQQQHFVQLQQTSQQSNVQQNTADLQQPKFQEVQQKDLHSSVTCNQMSPTNQQQEFLNARTTKCQPPQQNDQLMLLDLLSHMPPPQNSEM